MKSKSNRLPWMITGLLGCLAICLLIALVGGLFFIVGSRPTSTVGQLVPPATPGLNQTVVSPTASAALTPTSQPIVFPTPAPLNNAAVNLGALTSYQATLHLKATGTQGNQPFDWTYTITHTFRSDPALEVAMLDSSGLGQTQDYSGTVAIRTGNQFFVRWSAQSSCVPASQNQVVGLLLAPGVLLPPLGGAQQMGTGQVAGLAAERYQLTGKDTGVSGDVWLAAPGGYVAQVSVKQDGLLLSLGSDTKGHAEWEYSLASINKPVTPDLPLSCRHLLGDLPLPADAANLSATDDLMHYSTSTAPSDLMNFYADKMKQAGWATLGTPTVTNDSLSMAFTRQEETAFIHADKTDNKVDVGIVYQGP
ncbi:MAG: hypothetical protein KGJ80_00915 [Chloroflexota bacterium]|nr:hypothetical protein [Chloroflexota bacterium]